ncbi:MAG: hypothetical protein M3Q53_03860 [Actinomycetota bacterium]|nr:hypothetical protein [Actinomycetota bacterium]
MLFELGGKRKRVIQVIYVFLALLLGVGLVGLGIGGDANGGIFNALGIGGDDATQTDPAFDNQIERAEADLAADPKDEKALTTLARVHFLSAQTALVSDEQGNTSISDEAIAEYNEAVDAWERYMATKPQDPDDDVAALIVQAYANLAGTDPSASATEEQLAGAFRAAQIVAEARPSSGTFVTLATYAYFAGEGEVAEQARADALAEASDSTTKSQINQQIDSAQAQAKLVEKQLAQSAPDKSQLENPLEGLGGSSSAPVPGGAPLPGG